MAEHPPSFVALVAALRNEFSPPALQSMKIQLAEHRADGTSLGTLALAIDCAWDATFDGGEAVHPAVRAFLDRARAGHSPWINEQAEQTR